MDCLNFSVASISVMNEHSLSSDDEALMVTVENFVLEQLKLTKETIAQIKVLGFQILHMMYHPYDKIASHINIL